MDSPTTPQEYKPAKVGFRIWRFRFFAYWSKTLWENTLQDCDETEQKHLITLCRATSKDGIRLWQACFFWVRLVWGRTIQDRHLVPPRVNALIERAKAAGRDYVTPEDIGKALDAGTTPANVRFDILEVLSKTTPYGWEDTSLCAFIAFNAEKRIAKSRLKQPQQNG